MFYVFFHILKFRIKVFLYICTYVGMYVYIYNGFYIFKTCEYFLKCMFGPSEHWVAWHLYTTYSSKSTQAALPIVLVQQKSAPLSLAQWIEIVSIEAQISIKKVSYVRLLWTIRIGTNCTMSQVATPPIQLSKRRPLWASRICQVK